ncbi:MAG: endonuclease VII domain-containing protein [Candidatus Binatia bacterium]|nr:endonuclease VII domain-containing protein [Candidatus Binatia bacterium]
MLHWAYGIGLQDYKAILLQQGGVCAVCKNAETARKTNGELKWLAVDHCHATGKIRGLLCERCNHAIGYLNDNVVTLRAAALYLEVADTGFVAAGARRIEAKYTREDKVKLADAFLAELQEELG